MALTIADIDTWDPSAYHTVSEALGKRGASAEDVKNGLAQLPLIASWEGTASDVAHDTLDKLAKYLAAHTDEMEAVSKATQQAGDDIETVKDHLNAIDRDARDWGFRIDRVTGVVTPTDSDKIGLIAYQLQQAELVQRISQLLTDATTVDTELASAITNAGGAQPAHPAPKPGERVDKHNGREDGKPPTDPASRQGQPDPDAGAASSLEDLLVPDTGADAEAPPDSLDSALDQLTGEGAPSSKPAESAGDAAPGGVAGPRPLDPNNVHNFKKTAREIMLRDGVPPEQIEARLDAMVAAAQKPLPDSTPPEPETGAKPSFSDGFADGWFNTEEAIQDMVGAHGWEEFKDAWTDTGKGAWERITNPGDALTEEIEHATQYPGHYLGELTSETALTAPGAVAGGGLAARGAGELDDLAVAGAHAHTSVPDDLIDGPGTATGEVDHATPLGSTDQHTPIVGDHSGGYSPSPPVADGPAPPLPPDSPLFDGYDPTPPGPEFTNSDGGLIYPDGSLPSKPYAVPGTVIDNTEIPQGTVIDRFGSPYGSWLSPDGTPFVERALPPGSASKSYYEYVVDDPANLPPGFRIEQSQVAPWFHQPGGGVQYRIIGPDGKDASVNNLLDSGYLKDLHE